MLNYCDICNNKFHNLEDHEKKQNAIKLSRIQKEKRTSACNFMQT